MKKTLLLSFSLILSGCNNDDSIKNNDISIYAAPNGSYGTAFMLANAFSSPSEKNILSIGKSGNEYPYLYTAKSGDSFQINQSDNDFSSISNTIISESNDKSLSLYLGIAYVTNGELLTDEAFEKIENIYFVPEGTSLFTYNEDRINKLISFARIAKEKGVKNVRLVLWDSIDESSLLNSKLRIAKLPLHGIDFEFVSFDQMSHDIKVENNGGDLLTAALYNGAINESVLSDNIFIKSSNYDSNKKNIVLFGSYTKDEPEVSYINQSEILKKLESVSDLSNYNILFKGHPKEISVNDWIDNNSSSISYFKSFPYEIWQVLDGGNFDYTYKNESYSIYLPQSPSEIYSIFSTTLYGENPSKIKLILGYNKTQNGLLTDEEDPVATFDRHVYNEWKMLTGTTSVDFKMTKTWIDE